MSASIPHLARIPLWRRRVANCVFAVVLILLVITAIDLAGAGYSGLVLANQDRTVGRVAEGSPAELAGFRKGDVILAAPSRVASARPGQRVTYQVQRDTGNVTLELTFGRLPPSEFVRKLSLGLVAFAFFAVGWFVYVRRGDLTALVWALFCLDIGYVIGNVMNRPEWLLGGVPLIEKTLYDAAILLLPPLFLHFFLLFPERNERFAERSAHVVLLYAPSLIAVIVAASFNAVLVDSHRPLGPGVMAFQAATSLWFLGALLGGAILFVRSYRRTLSPSVRRRLVGVVAGTVAGVAPLVVGEALISLWPELEIPGDRLAALALILIPLSFGHAIVRYGMFDVEVVIKRGAVYAILTAMLAGLYLAVVTGVGRLIASAAPAASGGLTIVAILIMALVFTPLRVRVESWVDRTFYREKHGHRETLRRLARGLARMMDLDEILDLVSRSVEESFHPEFLAIYVRDRHGDGYRAARVAGRPALLPVAGSAEERELVGWVASRPDTVILERRLSGSLPGDIPLRLRRTLRRAHAALLIPFISEGELVAFAVIGSKKSDEPMSGEDAGLFDTVADHAATAIQNAWLHQDAIHRHELERELATARTVQRALLPPAHPRIAGFELEVRSIPSREIGGDLYDFIELGPRRWVLVIGDAAGHGIAAALLMAALQAMVHGEAEADASPAEVVTAANRRLCRRGDENRFASLVYVELDPIRGQLTYVNAGHPHPFVVTPSGDLLTLEAGGVLLGVDPDARYEQATLDITPGSLLLFYTDGIVDHAAPGQDEFGGERLAATLQGCASRPPGEIATVILEAVRRHTSSPITDDATLLILRYVGAPVPSPVRSGST